MKLLLTNDELHEVRGGTQVFIMDLARGLRARGHEIALYAWLRGSLADELAAQGIPVVGSPLECGFAPDVIHAQHHLAAMSAITAFPDVPAVYHCHGYGPWQERPPAHPRILHYLTMAQIMVPWISSVTGRGPEEITVVPNTVQLERFTRVRLPDAAPRRAVLFGNSPIPAGHIEILERACRDCSITLDLVGEPFGTAVSEAERILPEFDLAFAIGRSALEALASGCAVVLFSADGCGPMIDPRNLESFMRRNLTVPETTPAPTPKAVVREIRAWDAADCVAVTAEVRTSFSFEKACVKLEAIYERIAAQWGDTQRSRPDDEALAVSAYLAALGPHIKGADERYAALRASREKSRQRVARLKARLAALQAKWTIFEKRVPGFIRRWLMRDQH